MWEDKFADSEEGTPPETTHPPLSPATGAESLFLAGLATANISANALAEELRKNSSRYSSSSVSERSTATDDYFSAVCNPDDLISVVADDDDNNNKNTNDIIPEIDTDSDSETDYEQQPEQKSRGILDTTMPVSTAKASAATTSAPKKDLKTPPSSTSGTDHVDAATHIYEHAKDAWAWGKGVPVVSAFLGVTEAVVGKVAQTAGTSLEQIDGKVKPELSKFDDGVLNPAIASLVTVLLNVAGKTEGTLKPIIIMILSPFGLIKNEAENPEVTASKTSK